MLSTILAIILRITSNSFLNTYQKRTSVEFHPVNINFMTYFLLCVICLPLLFVFYYQKLNCEIIFWALTGGIFGALGNVCLIGALKYGELSILGPLNSYKAIVGLVFGILIIKEIPDISCIIGIVLIIFGSYFVFENTKEGFTVALFKRKDIQLRIFALVFSAIEAVFIKKVIMLSDFLCSFFLWVVFGCLFSFLIMQIKKEKTEIFKIKPFLPLCAFVLIMQLSTNCVFARLPVAPSLSLFQLSNILNIFLGYKVFKEKHILKKLTGAIVMIIGSVIIIF